MSGGHWDYIQYRFGDVIDDIKQIIEENDSQEKDEWGYPIGRGYKPEVIEAFKEAVGVIGDASIMINRIDWLLSGDDGEETFLERLEEDLA